MKRFSRRTSIWTDVRGGYLIDCALVASYVAIAVSSVMVPLVPVVHRLIAR